MRSLFAKRLFDASLSFLGIIISLPLWLIISILIYKEDKGLVYYRQERVGRDGEIFKVIKFRSMIPDAEKGKGPVQAMENDERSTRIGKFLRKTALDELPQLINILNGDMSFVGPRALRPGEIENKTKNHLDVISRPEIKLRNSVMPGLTGTAQIFAPRDILFKDKVKYDIWYIKNQSLPLDFWLIGTSYLITFLGRWETKGKKLQFLN